MENGRKNVIVRWISFIIKVAILLLVGWLSYKFLFANLQLPNSGATLNLILRFSLTTAIILVLAITLFPRVRDWINKHDEESRAISTIVSILTIISIIIGIIAYFQGLTTQEQTAVNQQQAVETQEQLLSTTEQSFQSGQKSFQAQQAEFAQEQQQRLDETYTEQQVEAENETAYLQDSIQDIDNDLSIASYFQTNASEWFTTNDVPVSRYSYPNLAKLEDDVILDQDTRTAIINSINNMDIANSLLDELSNPSFVRSTTLSKIQSQTIVAQGDLDELSIRLEAALTSNLSGPTSSSSIAVGTLKSRAEALSESILSFLSQQNSAQSSLLAAMEAGTLSETDFQTAMEESFTNTMNLYNQEFTVPVATIRDELAQQHLTDLELDENYNNPTNTFGIQTVAEKIGELAEKLP